MRLLVITLPTAAASPTLPYGWCASPDGVQVAQHGQASAAQLPTGMAERAAVVPAQALSWHRVQLPQGVGPRSPKLRAVLGSLLEDRLLDEPDQLHLALQPQAQPGAQVWVAACDKAWLQQHVAALEAAGAGVSRLVPAVAPAGALALHIQQQDDGAGQSLLLASGEGVDAGVALLPLTPGAPALAVPQGLQGLAPEEWPITATPATAAQAERVLQRKLPLLTPASHSLLALANGWELAQFDLAGTSRAQSLKQAGRLWRDLRFAPQWRPLRWGLALLLLAQLAGLNAWAWREKQALQAKKQAIGQTLTDTFAQVKLVVDAPLQMERELTLLRQAAGVTSGRDLESLLALAGSAWPEGQQAQSIEFNGQELRLRGLNLPPAQLQTLQTRAQPQGVAVRDEGGTLVLRGQAR